MAQPSPEVCDHTCGTDRKLLQHLARTVIHGRPITVHSAVCEPITGFLGGWYATSFVVLVPDGDSYTRRLIMRANAGVIDLHETSTYDQLPESTRVAMELIVAPFRTAMHTVLNRQQDRKD